MAIHPVGPLPATTYWRRRALLLLGVVVLLLLLRSCASGDDDGTRKTSTPKPSTTSTTAPPSPTGGAPAGCQDADLEVTPDTDSATYALGASPKLSVAVKNVSSTPCTRDLGSGAVELLVMSGSDRVWSSDDCNSSKAKDVVTLAPGAQRVIPITWAGKRSKPGCAGDRPEVKAGTYVLTARIGTLREGQAVFRFRS
jgi:hypothetical protein